MARAMVSWLVLLVSVVCVASAPMDVETKVRARAAADPRCSLPPPPPLRPTSSLLTPPLSVTFPSRPPPPISSSRPWQAMLHCRQDGQGHLRTLWLLRATTGTRPPCCASCEQWKSVLLRRRCVRAWYCAYEGGWGERRAGRLDVCCGREARCRALCARLVEGGVANRLPVSKVPLSLRRSLAAAEKRVV